MNFLFGISFASLVWSFATIQKKKINKYDWHHELQ